MGVLMRIIRIVAAVSLIAATTGVAAVPAVAAAPDNDTYGGVEVLFEPLPILVSADTTEATTDADDAELNAECGAPATDASVWYEYTPTVEGQLAITTLASDYIVGAIVATGGPGTWQVQSCGPEVIPFDAMPGTTYTILVFDDQGDGGGNGGYLEFTIDEPGPPPTLEVTVDPRGTFDARTGAATLTGTYLCAPSDGGTIDYAFLDVSLSQRAGRVYIQGSGFLEPLQCDGTGQGWTVTTEWANGLFKGGKAEAQVYAEACSAESCGTVEAVHAVKLSSVKK
jgi:hypothetical protein